MINTDNIEVITDIDPGTFLYHWDTHDNIEYMHKNGVVISNDKSDTDTDFNELDFEINYNCLYDAFTFEIPLKKEDIQLMRIEIQDVLFKDSRIKSKCVFKLGSNDKLVLQGDNEHKCIILPEYIQVSQVFDKNSLRKKTISNEKTVLKFTERGK